ncbi:hypothetical protein BGS_0904 [Beggiatoa sp. SS]|nr:hypothetical protein BGS_0904 [Beggiatoa sp. SS]
MIRIYLNLIEKCDKWIHSQKKGHYQSAQKWNFERKAGQQK